MYLLMVLLLVVLIGLIIAAVIAPIGRVGGGDDTARAYTPTRAHKCMFAGSSSINNFWTKTSAVYPFPGTTLKGLGKENNEARRKILSLCPNYDNVVLYFGEVDLMFSLYYDIKRGGDASEAFLSNFISSRVAAYQDFVAAVASANPATQITILVPWYNPIRDDMMLKSLAAHCVIKSADPRENGAILPFLGTKFRNSFVDRFAAELIRTVGAAYPGVRFIDIRAKIAPAGRILRQFLPQNSIDHHLGEPVKRLLVAEGIFGRCGLGTPMRRKRPYVPAPCTWVEPDASN